MAVAQNQIVRILRNMVEVVLSSSSYDLLKRKLDNEHEIRSSNQSMSKEEIQKEQYKADFFTAQTAAWNILLSTGIVKNSLDFQEKLAAYNFYAKKNSKAVKKIDFLA